MDAEIVADAGVEGSSLMTEPAGSSTILDASVNTDLERVIAYLEQHKLSFTLHSLLKELEQSKAGSTSTPVPYNQFGSHPPPPHTVKVAPITKRGSRSSDATHLAVAEPPEEFIMTDSLGNMGEPDVNAMLPDSASPHTDVVLRESVSSSGVQQETSTSHASSGSSLAYTSASLVPSLPTTSAPLTGEDSILRRLRDLVSDVGAACLQKVLPIDHSIRVIIPTLPENVMLESLDTSVPTVNTWSKGDLGYLPVVCPCYEEEVRELWSVDEQGNPLVAPKFPGGAGLSAARMVATLSGSVSPRKAHSPSRGSHSPYVRLTVPPRQLSQPPQLEVFDLKVIYEVGRTGFEEHKDFPIIPNSLIANRYQVLEYIGSAAFSRAVHCVDLKTDHQVCIKIIRNSKDFFDQSLDEIKLLQYLNTAGDADENCVVQLYDYFYYREHLFLVCELLKDNLYEFSKYNFDHPEEEFYFTMPRMQKITKSILLALKFIHKLNLMHCDLKPENILVRSYSRCEIKVIDFGSSCFITDHLSSYIQSRCYRAPEVILGMPYDQRIDIWSLGCILPELLTGQVLFLNDSVPQMLARIASLCGPYTPEMLEVARHAHRFFTRNGIVYERKDPDGPLTYLYAKPNALTTQLGSDDPLYVDFVTKCLTLDYTKRPTSEELLEHPFLTADYGPINP